MIEVVAGLIWNDNGQFMICQRPAHKARGLMWEFVGGKVEEGESFEDALVRECKEELDVTVKPMSVFQKVEHVYPDVTISLTLFNAQLENGIPKMLEHNDIQWITPNQVDDFDFCPADKEILEKIKCITAE